MHQANIELISNDNTAKGNYEYRIEPFDEDMTVDEIGAKLEDLYDSELFDIQNHGNYYSVIFLNPFVLERKQFRLISESLNSTIEFDQNKINYYTKLYNTLQITVQNNPFVKSVWGKFLKDRKLTKKQLFCL